MQYSSLEHLLNWITPFYLTPTHFSTYGLNLRTDVPFTLLTLHVCVLQQSTPSGSLYASDTGAQSPAQYPSIDVNADDDKARQASTARIGGSSALMDKVDISSYNPAYSE